MYYSKHIFYNLFSLIPPVFVSVASRTGLPIFNLISDTASEELQNFNLLFLARRSDHTDVWSSQKLHTHALTNTHGESLTALICPSDSAVSETGCHREGIYYRIDLAAQLSGNGNFSFHFSLCYTRPLGALKEGWSDV